jgi:hypothetical protein
VVELVEVQETIPNTAVRDDGPMVSRKGRCMARVRPLGFTLLVFLTHKILVSLPVIYLLLVLPHPGWTLSDLIKFVLVTNWSRWDSVWYEQIAQHGYDFHNSAFFPLYPALMRCLMNVSGLNAAAAGAVISNVCFFALLYFAFQLFRLDYDEQGTRRLVWMLGLFPTSYYFTAVYTESLFMLLCVWALYAMRQRTWFGAGVAGFFASMTRNTGVCLIFPFILEYFQLTRVRDIKRFVTVDLKQLSWEKIERLCWVVLIPLGLLLYMAFLYGLLHDPLAFSHAERLWHRTFHNPVWTIVHGTAVYIGYVLKFDGHWKMFGYTLTALLFVYGDLLLLIVAFWKLRLSYAVVFLYSYLIPMSAPVVHGNDFFMSISRYTLVVIPFFMALYELVGRKTAVYALYMLVSAAYLMTLVYIWTRNLGFIA